VIDLTAIVTPGRLVLGGVRMSKSGQTKPRGGRWTESNQYCAMEARVVAAVVDPSTHVPATSMAMTFVPTGVPPSALERRT
jgi:hypothetical protein